MSNLVGSLSAQQGLMGTLSTQQGLTGSLSAQQGLIGILSAQQGLTGSLSAQQGLSGALSTNVFIRTQTKTVIPSAEMQEVYADSGFAGLSQVTVNPIPSNYGKITWNGATLTVE